MERRLVPDLPWSRPAWIRPLESRFAGQKRRSAQGSGVPSRRTRRPAGPRFHQDAPEI